MFTGVVHRDNVDRFADMVLPQLLEPGLREDDFDAPARRSSSNALVQDLRSNNEEELGKERLQTTIFAWQRRTGTPRSGPPGDRGD